jgi:hypothetical protein
MFSRRQSRGRGRRQRRAAAGLVALAAAAMFTAQWPGPAAYASDSTLGLHAGSSSSHPGWVKYYVVQPPTDQHKEYLYEIALKTLGNGSLATTIFKLNRGRLQPDGSRLQDPNVIEPGWILLLPATASGPGVRFGPLPAVSASAIAASQPRYLISRHAAVVAGAILIALLLATGLVAIGGWRRNARAARPPHSRHARVPGSTPRALAPGRTPSALAPGRTPSALDTTGFPALGMPDQPDELLARAAPAALHGPASPSWPDYLLPNAQDPDDPVRPDRIDPGMPAHDHEVVFGDDRIHVVLTETPAAARGGQPRDGDAGVHRIPYVRWTPRPGDTPDGGMAFACVGTGAAGALFIDIGAAPGTISIGGDGEAAVRLAESIAHQLCAAPAADRGCVVVVIGDALPDPPPFTAAWIASARDLAEPTWPPHGSGDGPEFIFCRSSPSEDMVWLARYVSRARRRVIPVFLTSIPDAPWSFTAQPSRHPDESPYSVIA